MNTQNIKVKKGEKIQPAWERLVRWVDKLKVVPGEGFMVRETPNGTIITVVEKNQSFKHPFKVSASDLNISVGAGTVDSQSPYLFDHEEKKWLPIMNIGTGSNRKKPIMRIDPNQVNGQEFFICIRVKTDEFGLVIKPEEDLRIIQSASESGLGDEASYYPIALFQMNESKTLITEFFQITHNNIRYLYQPNDVLNRLLFFPA
jgi:hypothetical protein